jgi:hypothetical protein
VSTVDEVAGELGVASREVLDACRSLDIVASSGASGLSAAEHRRLRDAFGAATDLPPVVGGSVQPEPGAPPPADVRSLRARADELRVAPRRPRLTPRTATRVAVYAFLLVAVLVAVVTLRDRAEEGGGTGVQAFSGDDVGTCVDFGGASALAPVDCAEPHDAELYEVFDLDGGTAEPYPGQEAVVAEAERRCGDLFGEYVGRPYADSALDVVFLVPTRRTWDQGDRTVLCLVEDPSAPLVGSVAGTDR